MKGKSLPWHQVNKTSSCWLWTGPSLRGYGKCRHTMAHRVFYADLVGPIPSGYEIDHLCRVPGCVNPAHLEAVTGQENRRRKYAAIVACSRGHAYDDLNTYIKPDGRRDCRACIRARARAYRQRKLEGVS